MKLGWINRIWLAGLLSLGATESSALVDDNNEQAKPQAQQNEPQTTEVDDFDFSMADESGSASEQSDDFSFAGENSTLDSEAEVTTDGWAQAWLKGSRFTFKHEMSYKTSSPTGLVNNRSSLQLEFQKYFYNSFFFRLDTKVNTFWAADHQAQAEQDSVAFESLTREFYLQGSFGSTAVQLGIQNLIWGESDGGAITDVVSPRNFREIFYIPLEEARSGQFMIKLDQYSDFGRWTWFYAPKPKFNRYAEAGTAYYIPLGDGSLTVQQAEDSHSDDEIGMSWKSRIAGNDVNVMVASVINNDKALWFDGANNTLWAEKERNNMLGFSFNHVFDDLLLRGEFAYKTNRQFNDASLALHQTDVFDSAMVLEYSLPGNDTLSVEVVNNHIRHWRNDFVAQPRNSQSIVLQWNSFYFNEDLQINWLSTWGRPWLSWLSSIRSNYKVDDNLTLSMDVHWVRAHDSRAGLYAYRDQQQVVARLQYQF